MKQFNNSNKVTRESSTSIPSREQQSILETPPGTKSLVKYRSVDEVSILSSLKSSGPPKSSSIFVGDDVSFGTLSKDSGLGVVSGPNSIDVHGIRVVPSTVTFADTFENQSYVKKVFVQNVSDRSLTIRIYNPRAWSFRVIPIERGYQLAPGLKIVRCMHYTCTKSGIVHSSLPIYVNDKCYHLPLEAYKGQAFVAISPTSIDFGRVDIGAKPVEKRLVIRNASSCATKFLVDLGRNELDLQVTPLKGWIRPHSSVTICLQLIPLRVGELSSEIWITTDLSQNRIQVSGEACKRSLMALHPNSTSDFTLVEFPTTFYGCRRYQTVIIYNMAASSSAFVVLVDYGNKQHIPIREAQKGKNKQIKMFHVDTEEGRIRPFEGRIITICQTPPEKLSVTAQTGELSQPTTSQATSSQGDQKPETVCNSRVGWGWCCSRGCQPTTSQATSSTGGISQTPPEKLSVTAQTGELSQPTTSQATSSTGGISQTLPEKTVCNSTDMET
ncbi:hypothetical protein J6590_033951 [Homalodisca vitripennis]|nr:hypothetical protein J6590_033951 [Homalodisca vitripennis]